MTAPNSPQHNGVEERSFETYLNCKQAMLYQANFTIETATKLWGMALLYLQYTRNILSTMANQDKISPNSKFNNEDDLNISNILSIQKDRICDNKEPNKEKVGI